MRAAVPRSVSTLGSRSLTFSEASAKWRPPPIPRWACGIDCRPISGQFLSLLVVITKSPTGGLEGCPPAAQSLHTCPGSTCPASSRAAASMNTISFCRREAGAACSTSPSRYQHGEPESGVEVGWAGSQPGSRHPLPLHSAPGPSRVWERLRGGRGGMRLWFGAGERSGRSPEWTRALGREYRVGRIKNKGSPAFPLFPAPLRSAAGRVATAARSAP